MGGETSHLFAFSRQAGITYEALTSFAIHWRRQAPNRWAGGRGRLGEPVLAR
jgi:hypothetical protein